MITFDDTDVHIDGHLSMRYITLPDGCITDNDISSGARIASDKLVHRNKSVYSQGSTVECAPLTICLAGMWRAGRIRAFEVAVHTLMSQGQNDNRTVTFDLQNQSGTSVLVAPVTIDKTKSAKTLYAANIASPLLSSGDTLWGVVTVGGTTGTQAKGMVISLTFDEDPA